MEADLTPAPVAPVRQILVGRLARRTLFILMNIPHSRQQTPVDANTRSTAAITTYRHIGRRLRRNPENSRYNRSKPHSPHVTPLRW